MPKLSLALHGGAGTIQKSSMSPEKEHAYKEALNTALQAGFKSLEANGSAIAAVEKTVSLLEDSPLFNAGKGSVFTHAGTHEMDASIMDGSNLEAGAVAGITGIKNPISLSRWVMEKSEHVMLAGQGAMEFADSLGITTEQEDYFFDALRHAQWQEAKKNNVTQLDHSPLNEKKFGTVGAVAVDAFGNIAAATSTGGMTNKKFGRVGDSPVIGSGTYANNNTCAVSCTGSGEYFLRAVVAYDVSCLMEYKGYSLHEACEEVVHKKLIKINGDGGLIAVDRFGNIAMPFNTEGMYRACRTSGEPAIVKVYKD